MRHNKFINLENIDNTSIKENVDKEKTEYSNQIPVSKTNINEGIDINNPVVKTFFILLGLFCIIGTAYYIIQYFIIK